MTTINCSSNCKHQQDGKCMLENAISETLSAETDCVYFEEKQSSRSKTGLNGKSSFE